jgi:hypothetical protein
MASNALLAPCGGRIQLPGLSTFLKCSVISERKIAHRTGWLASLGRNCQYCLQLRQGFRTSCQQITGLLSTLFSKGSYALGHCGWYTELDHCNVSLCHSQGVMCAGQQCAHHVGVHTLALAVLDMHSRRLEPIALNAMGSVHVDWLTVAALNSVLEHCLCPKDDQGLLTLLVHLKVMPFPLGGLFPKVSLPLQQIIY